MDKVNIKKIRKQLSKVLQKYGIKAKRVIIFGSYMERDKMPNDIDIGIISEGFEGKDFWERAEIIGNIHWELVKYLGFPLDIIAISPWEWRKKQGIIFDYIKKGKVLI